MDFVVSKVAMSVCALMVASVLGVALGDDVFMRHIDELDHILNDLASTIERSVVSGCEETMTWFVPNLSSGDSVRVSADGRFLNAQSDGDSAALEMAVQVHTWQWTEEPLNASMVRALDRESPSVTASSGQALEVTTYEVLLDDREESLVFVRMGALPILGSTSAQLADRVGEQLHLLLRVVYVY